MVQPKSLSRLANIAAPVFIAIASAMPTYSIPTYSAPPNAGRSPALTGYTTSLKPVRMGQYVVTTPIPGLAGEVVRTRSVSAVKYRTATGGAEVMYRLSCTHDPGPPESVRDFRQTGVDFSRDAPRLYANDNVRSAFLPASAMAFHGLPSYTRHWRLREGKRFTDIEDLQFLAAGDVYGVSRSVETRDKPASRSTIDEADRRWREMIRRLRRGGAPS